MKTQRTLGLVIIFGSLLLTAQPATAQSGTNSEFAARMAAWQTAAPQRVVRPAAASAPAAKSAPNTSTVVKREPAPAPAPAAQPALPGFNEAPGQFDGSVGHAYGGSPGCGCQPSGMGCGGCGSACGCGACGGYGGYGGCGGGGGCYGGCGLLGGLFHVFHGCCGNPCGPCGSVGACGPGPCATCGPCSAPAPCDSCSGCGDYSPWCCQTLVWSRLEVLMWWRQGRDLPPLVTTSPLSTSAANAGVLPDADILFGGGRVGTDMQAGGRFDLGWWCDLSQCCGYGVRFFILGKDSNQYTISSLENPILAIPNITDGVNDALLVAYPGLRSGEIQVTGVSDVIGNDVYGRFLLCRDCTGRLDFITGWNYTRLEDQVQIRSQQTETGTGGTIPVGTVTDITDRFDARSEFSGAILGLMWERQCGCWSTRTLARMSIGNMHELVQINGSTRIAVPGQAVQTQAVGLFAADSNIGKYTRNEFTAITEAGFTASYRFANCTQLSVGYTLLYWNDAVTAGDSIDPAIGTSSVGERPQFHFRHSDYWVQGISLGLVKEF